MRIAFGQGYVSRSPNGPVEKLACDFAELEPIIRKEEAPGDPIDGQRLTKEDVIHSGGRIDRQFEVVVWRAKMNNAVCHDGCQGLPDLVSNRSS